MKSDLRAKRKEEEERERRVADVLHGGGDFDELGVVGDAEDVHCGRDDGEGAEEAIDEAALEAGGEEEGEELDMRYLEANEQLVW